MGADCAENSRLQHCIGLGSLLKMELVWIRTRDGSPTLWSNELGESFRSIKGAFTESHCAFVRPAIAHAQQIRNAQKTDVIRIGEFGLGLGTNWLLWSCIASHHKIPFAYTAIEAEEEHFRLGLEKWKTEWPLVRDFLEKISSPISEAQFIEILSEPKITCHLSPEKFIEKEASGKFDIWFHDPFGAEVNPDGYTEETLKLLESSWSPHVKGLSYACNRNFQRALKNLSMDFVVVDFEEAIGKRSRLEFFRNGKSKN